MDSDGGSLPLVSSDGCFTALPRRSGRFIEARRHRERTSAQAPSFQTVHAEAGVEFEQRERQTQIVIFRISRTIEAQLSNYLDPALFEKSPGGGLKGRPAFNPFSKQERQRNGVRGISRAELGSLMNPNGKNGKNGRDVWSITPSRESGEHAAVMPGELAERCIRARSRPGGIVLDPFCGFGTVGVFSASNC
jgi:tRNA G10  N-methylase Trm11